MFGSSSSSFSSNKLKGETSKALARESAPLLSQMTRQHTYMNYNDNIIQLLLHDQYIQRFFTKLTWEKLLSVTYRLQDLKS